MPRIFFSWIQCDKSKIHSRTRPPGYIAWRNRFLGTEVELGSLCSNMNRSVWRPTIMRENFILTNSIQPSLLIVMNKRRDIKEGSGQPQVRLRSEDLRLSTYIQRPTKSLLCAEEEIHKVRIRTLLCLLSSILAPLPSPCLCMPHREESVRENEGRKS
jgi:hypothetical protein